MLALWLALLLLSGTVCTQAHVSAQRNAIDPDHVEKIDDILLTPEQAAVIHTRKAVDSLTQHWPDVDGFPQVPYTFEDDLVDKEAIYAAIQHWTTNTCIKFTEVPNTATGPRLKFQRHASSCNSFVGMIDGETGQVINVPEWCETAFGSLVHEIGHAIGFWHEQSRSDRNSYVTILTDNIKDGAQGNFDVVTDNNWGVPYDFNSDMHYSGQAFSKNGKNTIVTIDPRYQDVIGQRDGLSHMDKLMANTMYGCTDKLLATCSLSSDPCLNYGYLGTDCNCVCPDGTTGDNCETLITDYNDVNTSPNTEKITSPKTITTENYPENFSLYSDFVKWIIAPECKRVKLTFNSFNIYTATDSNGLTACFYDALEIRTTSMTEGDWYCGTSITSGQEFISEANEMILYFKARTNFMTGWSADITFVDIPSCTTTKPPTTTSTTMLTSTLSSTTTQSRTSSTSTSETSTQSTSRISSTSTSETTTQSTSRISSTSISTSTTSGKSTTSGTTTFSSTSTAETSTTSIVTTSSSSTSDNPTTIPPNNRCRVRMENGYTYFTSPNFPEQYPNNALCTLSNITENLGLVYVQINSLNLQLGDTLVIRNPYTWPLILSGWLSPGRTFLVPSTFFLATFTSNWFATSKGFDVRFEVKSTPCHQKLSATTEGSISSPGYPYYHPWQTYCEWQITASSGKRIKLTFTRMTLGWFNFLAINPSKDPLPEANTIRYVNGYVNPPAITSDSNIIRIFMAGNTASAGFRIQYSEV